MEVFNCLLKAYYGDVDYDVSRCSYVFCHRYPPSSTLCCKSMNTWKLASIHEEWLGGFDYYWAKYFRRNNDNYYYGGIISGIYIMLTIY